MRSFLLLSLLAFAFVAAKEESEAKGKACDGKEKYKGEFKVDDRKVEFKSEAKNCDGKSKNEFSVDVNGGVESRGKSVSKTDEAKAMSAIRFDIKRIGEVVLVDGAVVEEVQDQTLGSTRWDSAGFTCRCKGGDEDDEGVCPDDADGNSVPVLCSLEGSLEMEGEGKDGENVALRVYAELYSDAAKAEVGREIPSNTMKMSVSVEGFPFRYANSSLFLETAVAMGAKEKAPGKAEDKDEDDGGKSWKLKGFQNDLTGEAFLWLSTFSTEGVEGEQDGKVLALQSDGNSEARITFVFVNSDDSNYQGNVHWDPEMSLSRSGAAALVLAPAFLVLAAVFGL